jgi:hypothetical protein
MRVFAGALSRDSLVKRSYKIRLADKKIVEGANADGGKTSLSKAEVAQSMQRLIQYKRA